MDVLDNYKNGKKSIQCRACDKSPESQAHLLLCDQLSEKELTSSLPDYNNIFCDNPQEIARIGRQLKTKFDKLKKIINKKPDAPVESAAASAVSDNCNGCIGNK